MYRINEGYTQVDLTLMADISSRMKEHFFVVVICSFLLHYTIDPPHCCGLQMKWPVIYISSRRNTLSHTLCCKILRTVVLEKDGTHI